MKRTLKRVPPFRAAVALTLGSALALSLTGLASPAAAQDTVYDGSKARVYLSANLRSLGEQTAATSCRVSVEDGPAAAELKEVSRVFDVVVAGLRDGDPTLGVPTAETHGRSLRRLEQVDAVWVPVRGAVEGMLLDGASPEELEAIVASHEALVKAAELLLADVSARYANPQELLQVDAMALNFLERQKMLLARMDRIVCGLSAGIEGLGTAEDLAETVALFDVSLVALRDGFPAAGVAPPRTDAVRGALTATHERWTEGRAMLDAIVDGTVSGTQTVAATTALTRDLTGDMHNVITLTMISSPGQADVYRVPLAAYVEDQLATKLADPDLVAAIRAQNAAHAGLKQEDIDALDLTWRAEAKAGGGPLVDDLMSRQVSLWLADLQRDSAGFITEAFVMDNVGLNVAQSAVTSDYWQGDEAKWQDTYADEDGGLHISEVEFDDSTGYYQTQASMPIVDPATGEKIGAVTFGINVQRLM